MVNKSWKDRIGYLVANGEIRQALERQGTFEPEVVDGIIEIVSRTVYARNKRLSDPNPDSLLSVEENDREMRDSPPEA